MTTYYDDRSVRVTSAAIRVGGRAYPLAEFTEVWHRRSARSWRVLGRRGALGVALVSPVVFALLGIVVGLSLDTSLTVTIAIVGGSVLVGLAVGPLADLLFEHLDRSYARGSRTLELWVRWQGRPVRLLTTDDALRFGQIYRALQRAVEQRQPVAPR
ncbi:DUF6232 family protein [Micromonospora sp. CPCC 206060]|uniref:DUF6232 family protein n=1 Tax=Micromonospora sp. CPCC 206060 TaxID=3122406 RepID=UPI002FF3E633